MLQARFVPYAGPVPRRERSRARFSVGYQTRLNLLDVELSKLGARNIVIQAEFEAREIRNDGWPRSTARPKGPAVIVSFDSDKGPLSFPCDTFQRWEDNLYAIARSLEALRAVDRYGVTRRAEQYRGWAQLPAAAPDRAFGSKLEASRWLAEIAGVVDGRPLSGDHLETTYRIAARRLHPDAGGSTEAFQRLQDAMRLLRGTR